MNVIGTDVLYRHAHIAFRQHAFPFGSEVGDDDKGHARFGRHGLEQLSKHFPASRGGADANNGKARIRGVPV
jgi:hypothetical protein